MLKILHVFSENKFDLHIYKSVPSKTPGHEHVYIHAPHDLDPIMRIALQAILSSDRKREALSLLRVINKSDRPPTCFFENDPDNPPPAKTPVLKKSAAPWKTTT